ncbi:MAG: ribulose-phosphate 3-epimerase [Methylacidiphilales bacterium]|nr:ribulose-phosphate 3-epimerase [Candidatus Methylacidiphilales bacterium]MDW8348797.1 ribulose-phosphate 3-epimerase [Verrucomicrobiae bacterium]
MRAVQIAPSILAADFSILKDEVRRCEEAEVEMLHLDIMDGHFVPNISFGPDIVKTIRRLTRLPLDVHLMIQQPDRYARTFIESGANILTVHLEAHHDVRRTLDLIHSLGCQAGLALNPLTLFARSIPYLDQIDLLLCMTVNPGFGGQKFMPEVLDKIRQARQYALKHNKHYRIEVDGGLNTETTRMATASGADIIVAGTTLFHSPNFRSKVQELRHAASEALAAG